MSLRALHRREVPLEWERQLAELSPPTDRFTYLKLRWEPGDPWETPVDRYIIDQMVPEHAIQLDVLEQLADYPSPRTMGNYYDSVLEEFVRNPDCLITDTAWRIFQTTRCWARPYWVIQGNTGGHKRWFSNNEKTALKMAGLPIDPPVPGSLPYAPFDERVLMQLRIHDLLRAKQAALHRKRDLLGDVQDARTEEEAKRLRAELVAWLAEQITEAADGVASALQSLDAPRADIDVRAYEEAVERAEENFIATGHP